jgi:hypothetical protein
MRHHVLDDHTPPVAHGGAAGGFAVYPGEEIKELALESPMGDDLEHAAPGIDQLDIPELRPGGVHGGLENRADQRVGVVLAHEASADLAELNEAGQQLGGRMAVGDTV